MIDVLNNSALSNLVCSRYVRFNIFLATTRPGRAMLKASIYKHSTWQDSLDMLSYGGRLDLDRALWTSGLQVFHFYLPLVG